MLNINEDLFTFLKNNYLEEQLKDIHMSFSLLEMFGLKYYEDKYTDIIYRYDSATSETKRDLVLLSLHSDMLIIINSHGITIDINNEPSLNELNEIANFLYIIQRLEDYDLILYRLTAEDESRNKIIDCIKHMTLLSKPRLMELIKEVNDDLIKSLLEFIGDREQTIPMNKTYINKVKSFFSFIENTDCLGLRLFNTGYKNMSFDEIISMLDIDITDHLDNLINVKLNIPQAALDCISLIIISKDGYELPLLKFKQNVHLFSTNLNNVTKLETVILKMITDFNMYYEAELERSKLNNDN